jgi:hypothetical protein
MVDFIMVGFIMVGFIMAASASRTTTIATSSAATIIRMITPIIITTRAAAWSGPTTVRGASAFTAIGIGGTGTTGITGEMPSRADELTVVSEAEANMC